MGNLVVTEKVGGGKKLVEAELRATQYAYSTASAGATVEAKREPLADFRAFKVFITCYSDTEGTYFVREYLLAKNLTELKPSTGSVTGDKLKIVADFILDGSDLVIEVTNNNLYNIDIVVCTILLA